MPVTPTKRLKQASPSEVIQYKTVVFFHLEFKETTSLLCREARIVWIANTQNILKTAFPITFTLSHM